MQINGYDVRWTHRLLTEAEVTGVQKLNQGKTGDVYDTSCRLTECVISEEKDGPPLFIGHCVFAKGENFCKDDGRKVSLHNALIQVYPNPEYPESPVVNDFILDPDSALAQKNAASEKFVIAYKAYREEHAQAKSKRASFYRAYLTKVGKEDRRELFAKMYNVCVPKSKAMVKPTFWKQIVSAFTGQPVAN